MSIGCMVVVCDVMMDAREGWRVRALNAHARAAGRGQPGLRGSIDARVGRGACPWLPEQLIVT